MKKQHKPWSEKWAELRARMEAEGTLDGMTRLRIGQKVEQAKEAEKAAREADKNAGFVQVYQRGWSALSELATKSPGACRLYAAIARSIDPRFGAVIASQVALGEVAGMHERNVRAHADFLEREGYIARFRAGGATAYCVDPAAVWCGRDSDKDKAAFIMGVIATKAEQKAFKVKCLGVVGRRGPKPRGAQPAEQTTAQAERSDQITIFEAIAASEAAEVAAMARKAA